MARIANATTEREEIVITQEMTASGAEEVSRFDDRFESEEEAV